MKPCYALRDAIARRLTVFDSEWNFPNEGGDDWLVIARLDRDDQHLELIGDDDCKSVQWHIHPPLLSLRGPAEAVWVDMQQDVEDSAEELSESVRSVIDGSTVIHYYVRSGTIFFRDEQIPAWRSHPIAQRILGEIKVLRWQGKRKEMRSTYSFS